MKYITILVDGMGDNPMDELGGETPLERAKVPAVDFLAERSELGLVQTIPEGMSPGSDIANLSVMGYAPKTYHTGRSPLEAASMGVALDESDTTFRCNLVTLTEEEPFEERTIIDHSSGDISTEESTALIESLKEHFDTAEKILYPGVSYRHLLLWKNGPDTFDFTPPHDILTKKIKEYLPKGRHGDYFVDMMKTSIDILKDHPVNIKRKAEGKNPANCIWPWGEGKKPRLDSFYDTFGLKGSVISAVDLIQGIGILAGLRPLYVEGATGTLHTNFDGKAQAAVQAFREGDDYVYLHLEAPDECGHQGDLEGKILSMERIDEKIVKPIYDYLASTGEAFKILLLPDHKTPVALRTHTSDPVLYLLYDHQKPLEAKQRFTEKDAEKTGLFFDEGPKLAKHFLS
ncbi:MAG TPA: cofactor-independent phosphoglycerate mutase [Eubacteriaceae bacterium]|nr:cofactor-independent phosphoglycerate mutase [Eubacteriaceae bacterium]